MASEKKTEQQPKTAQGFTEAYQKLCEEWGFRVVVTPVWVATNHGSFEMVQQPSVGKLPEKKN